MQDQIMPHHHTARARTLARAHARVRGAVGKALLVYWGTGSIILAVIAYIIFRAAGC